MLCHVNLQQRCTLPLSLVAYDYTSRLAQLSCLSLEVPTFFSWSMEKIFSIFSDLMRCCLCIFSEVCTHIAAVKHLSL